MRRPIVLAALCVAAASFLAPAAAQTKDNVIDPGMSKAEVIEHLGQPISMKTSDSLTFLYYRNGCEKTCGMNDVVMLAHDKVVDAIFRDPNRKYTGESSSPNQVSAAQARKTGQAKQQSGNLKVPPTAPADPGKAEVIAAPKPMPAPPTTDSMPAKADTTMPKPPATDSAAAKKPPAA